jgi:hypothetical protein
MTDPRLAAPVFAPGDKPKGPASYFPSIEKTYGHPMQHGIDIAAEQLNAGVAHMQAVEHLKTAYGMGHGHANAVVAWVKARLAA